MKHMLASITTKYAGPTGSKGSRLLVTIHLKQDGSKHRRTLPWLHQYGIHDNHQSAAKQALNGLPGDYHMDDIEVDGWTHDGAGHWVAMVKAKAPSLPNPGRNDRLDDLLFNIGHSAGILGNYPENYLTVDERISEDGKALLELAAEVGRLEDWMLYHKRSMRAGQ